MIDLDDLKEKGIIYGSNLVIGKIARNCGSNLGNPFGAAIFGAWDLLGLCSDKIKYGMPSRIIKNLGAAYYGLAFTVPDAISVFGGEYGKLPDLLLDGSMAYLCVKDSIKAYSANNTNPVSDIETIISKISSGISKVKRRKLESYEEDLEIPEEISDELPQEDSATRRPFNFEDYKP